MKGYLIVGAIAFALLGLSGCGKEVQRTEVPILLEPVDAQVDLAEVTLGNVSQIIMYSGEVVPYVEPMSFAADGSLEQIMVMTGDYVKQGDVLAELNTEQLLEEKKLLEEEICYVEKMGEFHDHQAELDIEIANTELLILQENWADEQTCKEKEWEIQKLELQLEQSRELRALELEKKQNALKILLEKEEKNQITAPFDGTVIYVKDVKRDDGIQAYEPIFYLADESQLSLVTDYIPEKDLANAERIYAKILDKDYEIQSLPYSEEEYISMALHDEKPRATFGFKQMDTTLESGQFAAIIVVKSHREQVLKIPVNALYQDGLECYVYRKEDGKRVRCDVVTGVISETNAEIIEGLKEGDVVYVKD